MTLNLLLSRGKAHVSKLILLELALQILSLTLSSSTVVLWSWRQSCAQPRFSLHSIVSSGENRDKKMLHGKTSVILAGIYQIRQSSWASCSSVRCFVSSLRSQEQDNQRDGDTRCAAGIGKGTKCLSTAFLVKGKLKSPVGTQWKLVLRAMSILEGISVCCCPARTHHEDWCSTALNWHHYSTVQKLCVLTDSYKNTLHSSLSGLSKGCCSFFVSLKSILDVGLKWRH